MPCACICMHFGKYTHIGRYINIYIYIYIYVYKYTSTPKLEVYPPGTARVYACMYIHIHIYMYIYLCLYTQYMYMHMNLNSKCNPQALHALSEIRTLSSPGGHVCLTLPPPPSLLLSIDLPHLPL